MSGASIGSDGQTRIEEKFEEETTVNEQPVSRAF